VLDYCPDVLKDKDVMNPIKCMWDSDNMSKRMVGMSMPAIRVNNKRHITDCPFKRFVSFLLKSD